MKRSMKTLWIGLVLLLAAVPVGAKNPGETCEEKLERIDARIADLSLRLNHRIWECYIDYARSVGKLIPITRFEGADYRSLLDTVPSLKAAQQYYREATDRWTEILKTDPQYESIHNEYVSLRGVSDKALNHANMQRYNLMYDRLRKNCPEYASVNAARLKAQRERNAALARYLLDYYRKKGREMIPDGIISTYSAEMKILRRECPEIPRMEEELALLRALRKELQERMLRREYGLKRTDEPVSGKDSLTAAGEVILE